MQRRAVAGTDVQLTELGFGGAPIGNSHDQPVDTATAHGAVDAAWHAGVRAFDTAPHYGLGLSERRIGSALASRPRDEFVVSSKVGRLLVPNPEPSGRDTDGFDVADTLVRRWDFSRDGVLRSIRETLERTGLDHLDVVYVHDPDDHWDQASSEAVGTLAELRDAGEIRAIGAGMNQSAMLARFLRETPVDLVMLAGRYTLLEQDALDDVLAAASELGKSVVAAAVFNSGLLSRPRPAADLTYDYRPAPAHLIARANAIADICEHHGVTLPAAAIAFPLAHPNVVNVTVGMRSAEEVVRNVDLYHQPIPSQLWEDLRSAGLLRADAPTP